MNEATSKKKTVTEEEVHIPTLKAMSSWASNLRNVIALLGLAGGIFWFTFTVWTNITANASKNIQQDKDIKELDDKVNNRVTLPEFKAQQEQVIRQYGTQKTFEDKTTKDLEEIRKWIEFHKGQLTPIAK